MTTTSSTAGGPFEERLRLTMLEALYSGKVREIYDAGPDHLLLVASDRVSAFDVVFDEAVPDKGRVLTAMTVFWAEALAHVGKTHLVSVNPADYPDGAAEIPGLLGRSMLVWRAEMLPVECIVRGYITGSAWKEYREAQTMHGAPLPAGYSSPPAFPSRCSPRRQRRPKATTRTSRSSSRPSSSVTTSPSAPANLPRRL